MADRIRLGILGGGRIVQRRILPAMQYVQEAELVAIASQRRGVAQELANGFPVSKSLESYEDLLKDSEIDAVYIPASGDAHHRWTVAAAEAGKHVLCEKPLAPTLREAEEMVRVCEDANVILHEAFMWRHHPRAQQVRDLVREGVIGDLAAIVVSFSFDIDRSDWRLRPERGGGAMWDLGCYGVNFARFLTGTEPEQIAASSRWWPTGVDMTTTMGLTFPDDVLVNIDCSFEVPFRCRADVVGTGGRILLDHAFQPDRTSTIQLWRSSDREEPMETVEVPFADQYACQINDFCRSIRAGGLLEPAENGLANMRVMQQVSDSAMSQRNPKSERTSSK